MGFLFGLLTAPLFGPVLGVYWLGQQLGEAAVAEWLDEEGVRGELLGLQMRFDLGEVTEEEYVEQERALTERLAAIREAKAE